MWSVLAGAIAALTLTLISGGSVNAQVQPVCPGDISHAATREQVEYRSGGHVVRGLIYRPARPNGAGVVMLHGARGLASDAPQFDPHAIQLASRGYYVLLPNYYDAAPGRDRRTSRDLHTWRRTASDGVAFLAAQPGADARRMATFGYSLGGFLSGEAAMEDDSIAAAVSVAGGTDVGDPERTRRLVPLFLIHARRDPVVSPTSTRSWASGLTRRGAEVEITELEWDGHGFDQPTWCVIFEATRSFLDRTIGTPP